MQDTTSDEPPSSRRRLLYSRDQFDDYWIALMSKLRINEDADALISGRSSHPLLSYQRTNQTALQILGAIILSSQDLIEDPFGCYERFSKYIADALHGHPGPVPVLGNLQLLENKLPSPPSSPTIHLLQDH